MVNSMVDRATSSMLIGPDWAMNIEICDICNHDPVQAKEVVKGIKKRIRSKNPKVQLLALTLLETIVKNCGDIVHMHVAERDVLTEMVKIVKKKPDFHVKEKVLTLVDTWQEAFGGARARYPQYFAAYQELLRIGAVFPQRSDSTAPVFTPPQTNPLTSFPQNLRNAESGVNGAESSSAEAEFPTLSLTEIQNARGIMDVLAEMLNAIDPTNKEELKQDVIVDLVEQCRNYKQRVVHLVNSTVDESLLEQGLTLNDELQRVLAKHEAIASGTSSSSTLEKSITESDSRALVPVDAPLIDTGDTKTLNQSPTAPSPVATNGPLMDFLSGDDFGTTPASGENSLAIVPTTGQSQPVPASPVSSDQNALALVDMFSQHNPQQQQNVNVNVNVQSPQYQNGFEQSGNNAWNGQPLQQPASPAYGGESGGDSSLPPPPWEAQSTDEVVGAPTSPYAPQGSPHGGGGGAGMGMYMQQPGMPMPGGYPQQMPGGYPQGMPGGMYQQPMQSPQMAAYMYQQQQQQQQAYNNQMGGGYGYGYGQAPHQQQNAQFLEQRMSGMSMRNDGGASGKSPSYVRPSKPEDKLFGDLVDMTKFKPK